MSLLDMNIGFPKGWSTPPFLLQLLSLPRQNAVLSWWRNFDSPKCLSNLILRGKMHYHMCIEVDCEIYLHI